MNNKKQEDANAGILRKKAEELLKKKIEKEGIPALDTDEKKLFHELQVHHIELEMQNEELRQAIETAETALKNYTMLYDLAPTGYLTLEHDGTISELNFTAADLLGERRFSLVNNNIKLFIDNDSLPGFNDFISKVFRSKTKESCELKLGHENNHSLNVFIEGIVTEEDHRCLLSVVDISRFKKK